MLEHVLLFKAIRALGINTPVLRYEILKPGVVRLYLAWGEPVEYDSGEGDGKPVISSPVADPTAVEVKTTKQKGRVKHGN